MTSGSDVEDVNVSEVDSFELMLTEQLRQASVEFDKANGRFKVAEQARNSIARKVEAYQAALDAYMGAQKPKPAGELGDMDLTRVEPSPWPPSNQAATVPGVPQGVDIDSPAPVQPASMFEGEHSLSCPWFEHFHGKECAPNCSTCKGN